MLGPRAALRLAALQKAAPLADQIMRTALDPDGGAASANVALRVLDAVDPLVEVSATASMDSRIGKLQRGEDTSLRELRALFGEGGLSAPAADALPAQTD